MEEEAFGALSSSFVTPMKAIHVRCTDSVAKDRLVEEFRAAPPKMGEVCFRAAAAPVLPATGS